MQTFLAHVDRLRPLQRDEIYALVGNDAIGSIRSAGPLGWLPVQINLKLTRAVAETLGSRDAHEFFCGLMLKTFDSVLLRGLVQAVLRIAGRDLNAYLGWVSKSFGMMFRQCGDWTVRDQDTGAATIQVVGLPVELVEDRIWLTSVASSLSALFRLAELEGAAILREVVPPEGRASYRLRWQS
jgi:hypothetical protein